MSVCNCMEIAYNRQKGQAQEDVSYLNQTVVAQVRNLHRGFPEYAPTPLANLSSLAKSLGIASLHVKDESYRLGLNAFKGLGGSYAICKCICEAKGLDIASVRLEDLSAMSIGKMTFVTATDGNHGRGVAFTCQRLGHDCYVYMPKGSSAERLGHIRALGAHAEITDLNYDDAVRYADRMARENGWILVQDTAWPGYEKIPAWIMQGYCTLMDEAIEQLSGICPTHVFLQAGVGSFAGAMLGHLLARFPNTPPVCVICEPNHADCIYRSFAANDGTPHIVTGDLSTIMAGLSCGEPNITSYPILRDYADAALSCQDEIAAQGMRILAAPLDGDDRVCSGESGAVTMGALYQLLCDPAYQSLKENLGLCASSRVLLVSTEGNTDAAMYQKIVWGGAYPNQNWPLSQ